MWFHLPHPACRFRVFSSLTLGAVDYLTLLRKRFHLAWPAVLSGDPVGFVHALKSQGELPTTRATTVDRCRESPESRRTIRRLRSQEHPRTNLPLVLRTASGSWRMVARSLDDCGTRVRHRWSRVAYRGLVDRGGGSSLVRVDWLPARFCGHVDVEIAVLFAARVAFITRGRPSAHEVQAATIKGETNGPAVILGVRSILRPSTAFRRFPGHRTGGPSYFRFVRRKVTRAEVNGQAVATQNGE